jgi:Domain of unknown function (DUF5753)/Helix-turn-helix domain
MPGRPVDLPAQHATRLTPPGSDEVGGRPGGTLKDHSAPRIALGVRLRQLRKARQVTRNSAGYAIRASASKISRLELGRVRCRIRDVQDLLSLYDADEQQRREVLALADQANAPNWWQPYHETIPAWFEPYLILEQAATLIMEYEPQFVPGLLQTSAYAEAVCRLGPTAIDGVARRVELRTRRQQQTIDKLDGPVFWTILDEAVLHRHIGGRDTMRAQLQHLLEMTQRPNVTVTVLPLRASDHTAARGTFSILRFAEPELHDIVYLEQLNGSSYLEQPSEVQLYTQVFDYLAAMSTPSEATEKLLQHALTAL